MTHEEFAEALIFGMPGVVWMYDGDGSTVDGLTFFDADGQPSADPPVVTIEQVQAWSDARAAQPVPPTMEQKLAAALETVQADPALAQATKDALTTMVQALTA